MRKGHLLHNMLQTLKKDSGAHFTYNIGVSLVRAGAVLLLAAAAVFVGSRLDIGSGMKYDGDTSAKLNGYWHYQDGPFATDRYYLVLGFEHNGRNIEIMEYVSEEKFNAADAAGLGAVMELKVYRTGYRFGYIYLSDKDAAGALREAREVYPPDKRANAAVVILLMIAVPTMLIGLRQERIAMKYPRSDVPLEISGLPAPPEDDAAPSEPEDKPEASDTDNEGSVTL